MSLPGPPAKSRNRSICNPRALARDVQHARELIRYITAAIRLLRAGIRPIALDHPPLTTAIRLARTGRIYHNGRVLDANTTLAVLVTATAIVGLFAVFERRIIAAIRTGKALAIELG